MKSGEGGKLHPYFTYLVENRGLCLTTFAARAFASLVVPAHIRLLPVVEVTNLDKSWTTLPATIRVKNSAVGPVPFLSSRRVSRGAGIAPSAVEIGDATKLKLNDTGNGPALRAKLTSS